MKLGFIGFGGAGFEPAAVGGADIPQRKGGYDGTRGGDLHHQFDRRGAVLFQESGPVVAFGAAA